MTCFANVDLLNPLDHLAPGGRVGLIALATDFNIESDLKQLYPDDVTFFTSRVRNHTPLNIENLRRMAPDISEAADRILPGTNLETIIFACTSGAVAIGIDKVTRLIHDVRPGVPVLNPATAAVMAFNTLDAKKISVLTAYTEAVNCDIVALFDAYGFEVINIAGFGFEDDTAATFITPDDIEQAAFQTFDQRSDLLFISCTALRASCVIETLEARLNVPVLCSNQVLVWQSLQVMNYPTPVWGFGTLMRDHLGSPPHA